MPPLNLNGTRWDELRHAYGPATDVPALLRSLASAQTRSEIDEIEGRLWSSVLHQGNVYTATPATLQYLFELMGDPARDVGAAFAHWLVDLVDVFSWETDDPTVRQIRALIIEALPKLLWLLDSGDREAQGCVIGALGSPTGTEGFCWEELYAFFERQASIDLKAEALMSLASIADQAGRRTETVRIARRLFESSDPFERCAGASALVVLDPATPDCRQYLISLLPSALPGLAEHDSWWGVGLQLTTLDLLFGEESWPGSGEAAPVIDTICSVGPMAYAQLDTLLQRLFPMGKERVPSLARDLTDDQRLVMSRIAESDGFLISGKASRPPAGRLSELWLPSTPGAIKKWLEGAPRSKCVTRGIRKLMKQSTRSAHHGRQGLGSTGRS